jgi:hypothetical protein
VPASDERPFRLRPRRPRGQSQDESKAWSKSFKGLMNIVRMTTRPSRNKRSRAVHRTIRQRCAVRVTYSPNRVRGQWGAHGRYIARESATRELAAEAAGFGPASDGIDVPRLLGGWQKAGDERLFKLIISPEFGDRLDLRKHTRDLMNQMRLDLGVDLEWVAVAHFNTGHPHVHVALRGVSSAGPLRLPPEYVKRGLRDRAEALCTAQLGYRTQLDALEAEHREIDQIRFTSLDRQIRKEMSPYGVFIEQTGPVSSDYLRTRRFNLSARLRILAKLGLASMSSTGTWTVRPDFETVLRSMQSGRARPWLTANIALSPNARSSANYDVANSRSGAVGDLINSQAR